MAYVRKTHDEYIVEEYVEGCGWEYTLSEETWAEAKAQAKCYRENGFNARARIVRVKNGETYNG